MLILVCFCTNEAVTLREKGEDEVRWDDVTDVFNAPPPETAHAQLPPKRSLLVLFT